MITWLARGKAMKISRVVVGVAVALMIALGLGWELHLSGPVGAAVARAMSGESEEAARLDLATASGTASTWRDRRVVAQAVRIADEGSRLQSEMERDGYNAASHGLVSAPEELQERRMREARLIVADMNSLRHAVGLSPLPSNAAEILGRE